MQSFVLLNIIWRRTQHIIPLLISGVFECYGRSPVRITVWVPQIEFCEIR